MPTLFPLPNIDAIYDYPLHRVRPYLCSMILLQLLLALYVVMLSALPCEALCRDESAPLRAYPSTPASQDCSAEEGCSPFCQCASCPGFAVPAPFELTEETLTTNSLATKQLPLYVAPHRLDVLGRIWQPPRLA